MLENIFVKVFSHRTANYIGWITSEEIKSNIKLNIITQQLGRTLCRVKIIHRGHFNRSADELKFVY